MKLFYYCKNVRLFNDDNFFVINLNFGSRVFGVDYLIANLNFHFNFFTVRKDSGTYSNNLSLLGFFFALTGKHDARLSGLFCD